MEKLLVASNFSFSHSVLKKTYAEDTKKQGFFWERVNTKLPMDFKY